MQSAADLVVAQVAGEEIAFFCGELLKHGGPRARRLVQAIATRELPDRTAADVAALLHTGGPAAPLPTAPNPPTTPRPPAVSRPASPPRLPDLP